MADRRWVINASPLIVLGKIGRLDLLQPLAGELYIPPGVKREIERGQASDPARAWIAGIPDRSFVAQVKTDLTVAGWNLGLGETEVLSYARSNAGVTAVIDDLQARQCALSLGLPLQGTIGVLLLGKKQGLLQHIRPLLADLRANNMHISSQLVDKALRLAGESEG